MGANYEIDNIKYLASGIAVIALLTAGLCFTPVRAEALPQIQTVQAININAEGAEHLHDGYASVDSWNQVKQEKIDTFNSLKEEIHNLSNYVDSETMAELDGIDTTTFKYIEDVENQITRFAEVKTQAEQAKATAEADAKRRAMNIQQTNSSTNYSYGGKSTSASYSGNYSGDYYSFLRDGVVYDGGNKYTYYSQSILPGGGLNIPGRHTDGGFVKDGDGYIVVANSSANGTVVNTPWGPGKVYDKGTSGNHYDIYVE